MKELEKLVNLMQDKKKKKEEQLSSQENYSAYTMGNLNNKRVEVKSYKNFIKEVSPDPSLKKEIIKNFTIEAKKIIEEINQIKN